MSDEKHKPWCSERARKENEECICETASSFAAPAGSAYYGVRVEVVGYDSLSCSAHLRRIADMIMSGDAPGWTTSDVNGSASADRFTPNCGTERPPLEKD